MDKGALDNFGRHIETALTNLHEYDIAVIAHTLLAVTNDPERCVAEYFTYQDSELRERALEALRVQREHEETRDISTEIK